MLVKLNINDNKAAAFLDLVSYLPYVKIEEKIEDNSEVVESISRAVEEMNLITQGKLKARNIEELFNEL